jgi:hypothetical protein
MGIRRHKHNQVTHRQDIVLLDQIICHCARMTVTIQGKRTWVTLPLSFVSLLVAMMDLDAHFIY